jgi:hypothetical protein
MLYKSLPRLEKLIFLVWSPLPDIICIYCQAGDRTEQAAGYYSVGPWVELHFPPNTLIEELVCFTNIKNAAKQK